MKGKSAFSRDEVAQIRELLATKTTSAANEQKRIRRRLRELGFYISDFSSDGEGFSQADFDRLVERRVVEIAGQQATSYIPLRSHGPPESSSGGLIDSKDESYVISLCDHVIGQAALKQHCFSFLAGDTGRSLPVDAYYPNLSLVVEYRERQHTEEVPFFDRRRTVSGLPRGEQRKVYDQRRRDLLPQHGITLVELSYSDFRHDSRKRILRDFESDLRIVSNRLGSHLPSP